MPLPEGSSNNPRMKIGLWPWKNGKPVANDTTGKLTFYRRLVHLLRLPEPDNAQLVRRIIFMERDVMLPTKVAAIAMLLHSFYFTPWIGIVSSTLDVAVEAVQYFFWLYITINLVMAGLLLALRWLPLGLLEWAVFTMCLVDGIFLSSLTLVTGGYDSILYWVFLGLIIRTSVSVPRATSQLMLNFTLIVFYVMAGLIDLAVARNLEERERIILALPGPQDNTAESLTLRLLPLLLMTICGYGVQLLFEKHRQAVEESREFALREGQLQSAGRLAAEFAHQIKNPLAIITNALYTLKRGIPETNGDLGEQIRIIEEEVERSDRIITQVMGYAQLSEGRVEKLDIPEVLDLAIAGVFPPGTRYPVKVHRDYKGPFPAVLMQRRHAEDIFANLLQNAREALGEAGGNIYLQARCRPDYAIEITIRDDGPGIPAEKLEKVFEAYYTTKEKGTGLGLASAKHNAELYGGMLRLESELGKGATFTLLFPGRTQTKPQTMA
jgi:signal transduction histidine kinase